MVYVARFTTTPQYDTQRNWSAWIAWHDADRSKVAEQALDHHGVDTDYGYQEACERAETRGRDVPDRDEWIEDQLEAHDIALVFNEVWGQWMVKHHDGLSCWSLEAENEDAAKAEALQNDNLAWHGFGQVTVGTVRYIAPIDASRDLHLFQCDDVANEVWE